MLWQVPAQWGRDSYVHRVPGRRDRWKGPEDERMKEEDTVFQELQLGRDIWRQKSQEVTEWGCGAPRGW